MGFPWYLSAVIAAISFVVLTLAFFLVSIFYFQAFAHLPALAAVSLVISSIESLVLAKDSKALSLILHWVLIAAVVVLYL